MSQVKYGVTGSPPLDVLLARHPHLAEFGKSAPGVLEFSCGDWKRALVLSSPYGKLAETEDNNPLVCADEVYVPGPATTLALIALSPLVLAELITEAPGLLFSFEPADLDLAGLEIDCAVALQTMDLGTVQGLNAMVEIDRSVTPNDLADLFDEKYGRAFFVRAAEGEWDTKLVAGQPHAEYRLRLTPGETTNLLTVQVMGDRDGKCGAAQVVHKLNIMCGFEETLGIC